MKPYLAVLFFIGSTIPLWASAQSTPSSFTTDVLVRNDGTVLVKETITVTTGEQDSKWFTRHIPLHFSSELTGVGTQRMEISNPQAEWDGLSVPAELNQTEHQATIEITPAPSLVVEPGKKELTLSYIVDGVLRYGPEYTQLVWLGLSQDDHEGVRQYTASVEVPQEYPVQDTNCYFTEQDTRYKCSVDSRTEGEHMVYYAHRDLQEGQDITIVANIKKGIEGEEMLAQFAWWQWLLVAVGSLITCGLLWIAYLLLRYKYKLLGVHNTEEK